MKKLTIFTILTLFLSNSFLSAQISENYKRFVKGNLQDKILSVRESSATEVEKLSLVAINFCLENKEILKNDRDLDALCIASVLSVPQKYIENLSLTGKTNFSDEMLKIFNSFENENVKIAVLTKISQNNIPNDKILNDLNSLISKNESLSYSQNFLKSVISTLGIIGNSETFKILYQNYKKTEWKNLQPELKTSIVNLCESSDSEISNIISAGSLEDFKFIFENIVKNEQKSQIFRSQIAETLLQAAIYIVEANSSLTDDLVSLQVDLIVFLAQNRWTRGVKTILNFYNVAKKEFNDEKMSSEDFGKVITSVSKTAPIESVSIFSDYLIELNKQKEKGLKVSEEIVLALISALGEIGDKNAFDSLLSVTYYNYSDTVINKARSALASLKW